MQRKRVINDISKYTPRSKVGLKAEPSQNKVVDVSARCEFSATPDGYFVWSNTKKTKHNKAN